MAERPGISETSDPQARACGTGHTDMWACITALRAEVEALRQREAAYDTLVRAGEERQRRALGLDPPSLAPRRRGLRVIPGLALVTATCMSQIWTGRHGPRV